MSSTQFMPVKAPVSNTSMCIPVFAKFGAVNSLYVSQVKPTITEVLWGGSANYIQEIYAYPFDPTLGTGTWRKLLVTPTANIDTGGNNVADVPLAAEQGYDLGFTFIPEIYGDFRDYEPFVKYSLYLPYYGEVALCSADVKNQYIRILLTVDFNTGTGCYILALQSAKPTSASGFLDTSTLSQVKRILAEYTFQLGVERPFTNSGFTDMKRNYIMSMAFLASRAARSVSCTNIPVGGQPQTSVTDPSTALTVVPQAQVPVVQNTVPLPLPNSAPVQTARPSNPTLPFGAYRFPAFSTAMQALGNLQSTPQGSTGYPILNLYSPTSCQLIIRRANFINNVGKTYGRTMAYPAEYTCKLNELVGYTLVNRIDMYRGFANATSDEREAIANIVEGGIYIEYALASCTLNANGTNHTIKFVSGQSWRQFISTGMNSDEYQGAQGSVVRPVLGSNQYKLIAHYGNILTDIANGDYGNVKDSSGADVFTDAPIIAGATYTVTT